MDKMLKLAYVYENDYDKYPDVSHKDLVKRVDKINELKKKTDLLLIEVKTQIDSGNTAINNGGNSMQNGVDLEKQNLLVKRGEDGEYEESRGKDNK